MESASLSDIKKALMHLPQEKVIEYALRLSRYKKENKELMGFVLFLEGDMHQFINDIKHECDALFEALNVNTAYYSAKGLRKILKNLNKYIRFSGSKETEAELLIYFCKKMRDSGVRINASVVLTNLYNRQLARIFRAVESLHDDRQADYREMYDLEL